MTAKCHCCPWHIHVYLHNPHKILPVQRSAVSPGLFPPLKRCVLINFAPFEDEIFIKILYYYFIIMLTVKRQGFKYLLSYSLSTQKETYLYFVALATELYGNSEMGQVLLPGRADSWIGNEKAAEILYIDLSFDIPLHTFNLLSFFYLGRSL